jgi:glycosyltransferase involved in cell wall biosynthesis
MRVVFWGTYDTGKPRVRILLWGLRENGVEVIECHKEVWGGIEDKSQLKGLSRKLRLLLNWLLAYPVLVWRYLRLPKHDAVVVGYLGQLDVLILWAFARLRGVPIVWDAFLSLYNTVVEDRRMVGPRNPLAWLLWTWEWLACRAADLVVLDTNAHGRYFIETFGVPEAKVKRVFVGAETDLFKPRPDSRRDPAQPFTVLFYGQFIPLHGIDTVVRAAKLTEAEGIHWVIVGTGQEAPRIRALLETLKPANLEWVEWVPYSELVDWLHKADVCLGIFGTTDKATRVIPNKAFQIIAAGRPLITADTVAMRELTPSIKTACDLVEPGNAEALANSVRSRRIAIRDGLSDSTGGSQPPIAPRDVGRTLQDILLGATGQLPA